MRSGEAPDKTEIQIGHKPTASLGENPPPHRCGGACGSAGAHAVLGAGVVHVPRRRGVRPAVRGPHFYDVLGLSW